MNDEIAAYIAGEMRKTYRSSWLKVDQPTIDRFADATRDWNWLHVDPVKAAQTSFGSTIAHGFLVLSLLAPLRQESGRPPFPQLKMGMNYGVERVRFVSPVRAGTRIRGVFSVTEIKERDDGQYLEEMDVTVEIEGEKRPALVARWLTLYVT